MILGKIDVTKIPKERIFVGAKGKYIDICLIETPNDQYGNDYMITLSIPKAERDQGVKGPILGNAKVIGQAPAPRQQAPAPRQAPPARQENPDEDVPF